ncbi:glycosyltransferase family 1 protein [Aplosporella prunicola CBS 121167]|uniref:Glycosyltransferase family 1 protein n=1 Tax=Aplosporella prunicola CBS 121167 TaxID=1176127 RepID=A0A6A6B903_9PEZI|nr:glycosyltransferase family 1 protein [Aplosporella prunicola CBS 121167]KAF2140048.1 glycosyltransferase family 1 protein [Aplosporella prunicola CBS 121167]
MASSASSAEGSANAPNPLTQATQAIAAADSDSGSHRGSQDLHATASSDQHEALPADQPPPYSGGNDVSYGKIVDNGDGFGTSASLTDDGRVNIRIDQKSNRLSNLLIPALRSQLDLASREPPPPPPYIPPSLGGKPGKEPPPPLNVVIHVVGSRGDVQPFVALGKVLKETYSHRVRLATHPVFRNFVEENGLEFFSIGGDPSELMAFMVKNPGLMPGFDTLRNGDVGKRRKGIAEMIDGCWKSCIEPNDGFGVDTSQQEGENMLNSAYSNPEATAKTGRPFIADAIIANPPSFAHIHCAEKLGVPLHMMFTMPWSPTQSFQHPLATIQSSNADASLTNYMTYALVDMLTWQGLGDIINKFRQRTLHLDSISAMSAPSMLSRLRVPFTYCWSPALIPKPKDWGNHITISGFYFLNLATNFRPDPDLAAFLDAGPPPVYIGFGSIVVDNPNGMTKLIFEAVQKAGVRALVSKGWGGFGADQLGVPESVFMLGNVPHDWLFKRVSCVVHHGGAGTTAAGIACGKPTVIVPFFGDQPFWGSMVARAGAGPEPIHHKQLTSDNLAEAIQEALKPTSQERARELAAKISNERGSDEGAQYFHQHLKVDEMRCSLLPNRAAVWRFKKTQIKLSALAAVVLANEGMLNFADLKLFQPRDYEPDTGPWDPVTGVTGAVMGTVTSMMMNVADLPIETLKALNIHPDSRRSRANTGAAKASTDSGSRPGTSDSAAPSKSGVSTPTSPENPKVAVTSAAEDHALVSSPIESPKRSGSGLGHRSQSSLGQALGALEGIRSRSRSGSRGSKPGPNDTATFPRVPVEDNPNARSHFDVESALQTGKGLGRIAQAGAKAPVDVMMGLSKGFHNASRLYGEEPRQVEKVTGLSSGLKVATREFGQGLFEGISGLVTQPYKGAKADGPGGFVKGMAKGFAGVVLKPQAAAFAVPAYTMKGIYMEVRKPFGSSIRNYIIASRTAQGWEEYNKSTSEERSQIVGTYRFLSEHAHKKKGPGEREMEAIHALMEKRKKGTKQKSMSSVFSSRKPSDGADSDSTSEGTLSPPPRSPTTTLPVIEGQRPPHVPLGGPRWDPLVQRAADVQDAELEEAIRQSVRQTSHGNAEEDELIERAMRASVAELGRVRRMPRANTAATPTTTASGENADDDEEEALRRAMAASLAEHEAHQQWALQQEQAAPPSYADIDADNLAEAMRRSALDHDQREGGDRGGNAPTLPPPPPLPLRGDVDPDEDEVDEELRRAIEASEREGREKTDADARAKREEDIVLEYVKKQSLLEEEYQRKIREGTI